MVSPALAVEPATPPTSAVLVKSKVAQLTVISVTPVEIAAAILLAFTDAPLSYVPQFENDVVAVMCTERLALGASVTGWPARVRLWLPSEPLIANEVGSPVVASLTQCTGVVPVPPGKLSVRVTPVAAPAPV